jgi:hypothetical protein
MGFLLVFFVEFRLRMRCSRFAQNKGRFASHMQPAIRRVPLHVIHGPLMLSAAEAPCYTQLQVTEHMKSCCHPPECKASVSAVLTQ